MAPRLIIDHCPGMDYNEYCIIPNTLGVSRCLTQSALEGGIYVAEIKVGKNESLDNALRRFKRQIRMSGVLSEARKREHYEKPSVRRKKKSEAARKRKYRR